MTDEPIDLKSLRGKKAAKADYVPVVGATQGTTPTRDYATLDYKTLSIDRFFPGVNERVNKFSEKDPLVPLGRLFGDNVLRFEDAHETPYQIARRIFVAGYEREEVRESDIDKERLDANSRWLVRQAYELFDMPEYAFLRNSMERTGWVDFMSTLVLSKGKIGVIWRSIKDQAPPGKYTGNTALGLITEFEDAGYVATSADTVLQLSRVHKRYREGVVETIGDIVGNENMQRELRLIGASQAMPIFANAFNSTNAEGNADPAGYFEKNYIEKIQNIFNPEHARRIVGAKKIIKALPPIVVKGIEKNTGLDISDAMLKLEEIVSSETDPQQKARIRDALLGSMGQQQEAMKTLTEYLGDSRKEWVDQAAVAFEGVPLLGYASDWFKEKLNNASRLVSLGVNIAEMALVSVPYSSEFLERAAVEDVMELILQSYLEGRPLKGFVGEHAQLPGAG